VRLDDNSSRKKREGWGVFMSSHSRQQGNVGLVVLGKGCLYLFTSADVHEPVGEKSRGGWGGQRSEP